MREGLRAVALVAILLWPAAPAAVSADRQAWLDHMEAAAEAQHADRVSDAEAALRRAVEAAEHPPLAPMLRVRSVEALADLLRRAGRADEAEPLYRESIESWRRFLGPRQPRVGIPMHNLAALYLERCRVDDAVPLIDRTLELWRDSLGPEHPDRVTAIRTQATLLGRCGAEDHAARILALLPEDRP